jgi:glycosyltransferase involved in cell wall biosynthesis
VYALGAAHDADLRWMIALRRLLSKGNYDIVHFHLPYAASLGQLAVATLPRSTRPGVVYTEHTMWNSDPPGRGRRLVVRGLLRASIQSGEQLVAVSQASHDALPTALRQRATTLVHAVDLSQTDSLLARRSEHRALVRAELGIGTDELVFITVANLRRTKGYDVLLNAARSVADCGLPIRFVAVGYGPMRDALQAQHAELALGDRFQFLGQRDDVLRLLAGADAFVLPSTTEGLGVALMEATSMALPIVATTVGGVPEILDDEIDALLIPPGEPAPLVEAMRRLATDPELRERLGKEAKLRSSQFDMEKVSRAIEEIYERAARLP